MRTKEQIRQDICKLLAEFETMNKNRNAGGRLDLARGRDILDEVNQLEAELDLVGRLGDFEGRMKSDPDTLDMPWTAGQPRLGESRVHKPTGRTYREMFGSDHLDTGGFSRAEEFVKAIHAGRADSRLDELAQRAMVEDTPSSGGFSVPDQFAGEWLDSSLENEIIRPLATVWPMTSKTRSVPGFDAKNHSYADGLFGGIKCSFEGENTELTQSEGKLRLIELSAKKMTCLIPISNELLADGLGFESQLGDAMSLAMGWYLDYKFINGSGAGQPLGLLSDPAKIEVSKESGQTASTVIYENLTKMFARLIPWANPKTTIWIANQTLKPQLLGLSFAVGTAGNHVPVMTEQNGEFRMLGYPCKFTEKAPALGSAGQLMLADLSRYAIGLRKEITLDKSQHVGFTRDVTYFRAIIRVDGQGKFDAVVTPENGDSLSWIVTLVA